MGFLPAVGIGYGPASPGGDGNQLRLPLALRVKLPHSWDRGQSTSPAQNEISGWKYMDQLLYEGVVEFGKQNKSKQTTNVDDEILTLK